MAMLLNFTELGLFSLTNWGYIIVKMLIYRWKDLDETGFFLSGNLTELVNIHVHNLGGEEKFENLDLSLFGFVRQCKLCEKIDFKLGLRVEKTEETEATSEYSST